MPESKDNQFVVGKMEKTLSSLVTSQKQETTIDSEPATGYKRENVFNDTSFNNNSIHEYPRMNTPYQSRPVPGDGGQAIQRANNTITRGGKIISAQQITPKAHTLRPLDVIPAEGQPLKDADFFVPKEAHFIRDVSQGLSGENNTTYVNENEAVERRGYINNTKDPKQVAVFSGSTTNINPHNDPLTKELSMNGGLSHYLEEKGREKELGSFIRPPVSPIHPFTRLNSKDNPHTADEAILKTYNRTKLPVADIEWRKGFRHIFITRPECYLMYNDGGTMGLCDQAFYDEDFASAVTRMPHIIRLLSPWYVSGSFTDDILDSNWNFLLSNRVQGMSATQMSLSVNESISKSLEGFTVTPAMHLEGRQGSTLDLSFRDTKTLEVFETARLWMLYMYKRKKGIFIPPYNGYQKTNAFMTNIPESGSPLTGVQYTRYHPYDRALEYCASLYDIVTNESGTKILYWCKYYGIYPISVNPNLTNDNNGPITEMTTNITFKYHYKLENTNKVLVEFNHDAGITDDVGSVKVDKITNSLSFLLRDEYDDPVMPKYIGASSMFTGSPYIVMAMSQPDPLNKSTMITVPNLRFVNLKDLDLDGRINLGITHVDIDQPTKNVIGYK